MQIKQNTFPLAHLLGVILFSVAGIIFITYVVYQARFLVIGPVINLTNSSDIIRHERLVTLTGSAKNITSISVNNRPIVTDEAGHFAETIVLENGYTVVRISAVDRYGRETTTERSFVYVPQSLLPTS